MKIIGVSARSGIQQSGFQGAKTFPPWTCLLQVRLTNDSRIILTLPKMHFTSRFALAAYDESAPGPPFIDHQSRIKRPIARLVRALTLDRRWVKKEESDLRCSSLWSSTDKLGVRYGHGLKVEVPPYDQPPCLVCT